MQEIHALTLASLHNDMARLDSVAANLANVSTPGYKRQVVAARSFQEAVDVARTAAPPAVLTDNRAGTVRTTGQSLDLVLGGDGYFEVLTPQGPAYTRRGNFAVDARGRLVTPQGLPVMGKAGEIQLAGRAPAIDADGRITESVPGSESPTPVGQIKVVRFEHPDRLQRLGDGLFAGGEGMTPVADGEVRIRQGALENANVNVTSEMVDLIQTMRHFEAVHRVVQGYDEMIGGAVRKLAES
ncbi:MAG TPA: flagellar hook-basal body protein [Ramlibacter sp.]|nr:flagellar hook-basal body protein [Ramlibacter sp.]